MKRIVRKTRIAPAIPTFDIFSAHCPHITTNTTDCDWVAQQGFLGISNQVCNETDGEAMRPVACSSPYDDGIHPNNVGYYHLATAVEGAVLLYPWLYGGAERSVGGRGSKTIVRDTPVGTPATPIEIMKY